MGILIAGIAVVAMLLATSSVMFSTFIATTVSGGQSIKSVTQVEVQRRGSTLSITNAGFVNGGTTDLTVEMKNTGSEPVVDFADMDVIVEYTDASDKAVLTRLQYKTSGIGNNQWTLAGTGVTPDSFNPQIWDADENLFIELKVSPAVKSAAAALIVVGTPWAGSDQTTAVAP